MSHDGDALLLAVVAVGQDDMEVETIGCRLLSGKKRPFAFRVWECLGVGVEQEDPVVSGCGIVQGNARVENIGKVVPVDEFHPGGELSRVLFVEDVFEVGGCQVGRCEIVVFFGGFQLPFELLFLFPEFRDLRGLPVGGVGGLSQEVFQAGDFRRRRPEIVAPRARFTLGFDGAASDRDVPRVPSDQDSTVKGGHRRKEAHQHAHPRQHRPLPRL